MLHIQPGHPASSAAKDAKEAKKSVARAQAPSTVRKDLLRQNGMLLSRDEIAIIKSLNLPKGRHHRREINALLRKSGIYDWTCHYSIIRGNGMHGEGDELYAIYRDAIDNKPVVIGQGATAKVKNVQNLRTGEWPVLKVVSHFDEYAANEFQLLQELGKVDSLLIQKPSKSGVNKREILMKRANGVELTKLIIDKQLPTDATTLKKIALNILRELKKIHDQGIILRDIKLENIMLDLQTGEVTLIDFGFALKAKNGIASDGHLCGTMAYIPFEMVLKKNKNYSVASDLYAAGIVLRGLLTGSYRNYTKEKGLPYTDSDGFYNARDAIQRVVKQGGMTIPYVVEKEIEQLINSLTDFGSDKPLSLEDACKIIEKHIPQEQVAKASDSTAPVSQLGMFKNLTLDNKPAASASPDDELDRLFVEEFGQPSLPAEQVKDCEPAAHVYVADSSECNPSLVDIGTVQEQAVIKTSSDGPYLKIKELERRQQQPISQRMTK